MSSAEVNQSPHLAADPSPPQEWLSMAQSWLSSSFSDGNRPSSIEFEDWFNTNAASLPEDVKSAPLSQLYQTLMDSLTQSPTPIHLEQGGSQNSTKHAKFQRTDQWQPVYSWLESLNRDEVVRSEDIAEWLDKNPSIKEDLSAKHSRYHLMHYVKKCHFKILKRRDMKKGLPGTTKLASEKILKRKDDPAKQLVEYSSAPMNIPKDNDLLLAKRNEALQKFEILVEFENQLLAKFP